MFRAVLVLSVLLAGVARGDLLGDIQKQTATTVSPRAAAKLRDAQAKLAALDPRGPSKKSSAASKAAAASVTSAARALDEGARRDAQLRSAAGAVRVLAAYLK